MLCLGLFLATAAAAPASDDTRGAVEQSGGYKVPQNPSLPKLNLSDAQREQIRKALLTRNTQIEFKMKETKPAESFEPKIGAALPAPVKPTGFPGELSRRFRSSQIAAMPG
jgi:hypothetical protein